VVRSIKYWNLDS